MPSVGPDQQAARDEAKKRQAQAARDEIDELLWLMSDPRGRRFMWRRLTDAGVYQSSFVPGDFSLTAFNEGRRNTGLRLISLLTEHCPARFSEMQKEARTYERRNNGSGGTAGGQ
ncbi:endopeptidase [Variovorax sp.]|uniref:Bbp19 family protein n=1 Tax=Variovorax sp. TaxID=1871043 RepID=UPI003BA98C8F